MKNTPEAMQAYLETHPFDSGSDDCAIVLEEFLHLLPLSDNNAVCNLFCRLCGEYKHKAFIDGLQ